MSNLWFFFDFLVCLVVGMNAVVGIGLVSRLGDTFVVPKWKNVFLLSLYITTTFTITLMTEQMFGVICLSYLPLLAIYEFLNYKQILTAVLVNPFIYLAYYCVYEITVTLQAVVYITLTTYAALAILLYIFGKSSDSQSRLLVSGVFIGIFEILNQVNWYHFTMEESIVAVVVNVVSYASAIILIDLLYLKLLKDAEKDYKEKYIDKLTNLYNYNSFSIDYNGGLVEENYIMGVVDVNKFKKINDTYGHDKGNQILEMVSDLIAGAFAEKYKLLNYKVYRYGGEEIIVVIKLEDESILSEKMVEVSNILLSVNSELEHRTQHELKEPVSFSAGITAYELCKFNNEDTFTRADELLYEAKTDKDTIVVVDDRIAK